jgi:hypothetical protein
MAVWAAQNVIFGPSLLLVKRIPHDAEDAQSFANAILSGSQGNAFKSEKTHNAAD